MDHLHDLVVGGGTITISITGSDYNDDNDHKDDDEIPS